MGDDGLNEIFMKHRKLANYLVGLVLVLVGIFSVFNLLREKVLIVGDFTGSDLLDMHLPYKYILSDAVVKGGLPWWSDKLSNGMPFLAEGQSGVLYPVNLALAWLEPTDAMTVGLLMVVIIAAIGMYGYLRYSVFKLSVGAALLGAVAFAGSSVIVFRVKHFNYINAIALLPFLVWSLSEWQRKGSIRKGVWVAVVLALVAYTGAPPFLYYFGLFAWVYLVVGEGMNFLVRPKIWIGMVWISLLAGLLAAPQILPTLEYSYFTSRGGGTDNYLSNVAYPFNPVYYLTLFYPYIFGNPADGTYRFAISAFGVWWENVLYIGLIPILAVVVGGGVWLWERVKRKAGLWSELEMGARQELRVWLVVGLFFGFVAWGKLSILHMFLHTVVPGFSYFRFPQRFNVLVVFGLCVAAAVVFSLFEKYLAKKFADRQWLRRILVGVVIGLTVVDLVWVYSKYFVWVDRDTYFGVKPPEAVLEGGGKIYSLAQYYVNPYAAGWKNSVEEIVQLQYTLPGDNAARYGLKSFSNRNWFEGGLVLKERAGYEEDLLFNYANDCERFKTKLSVWGVRYVSSVENEGVVYGELPKLDCMKLVERKGDYVWYEIENAWPEVYLTEVGKEEEKRVDLNGQLVTDLVGKEVYKMNIEQPMLMVVAEYDYVGWEVRIDGVEVEKFEHPLKKRSVVVPVGEHSIEWKYVPRSFYWGVLGWSVGGTALLYILLRKKYN